MDTSNDTASTTCCSFLPPGGNKMNTSESIEIGCGEQTQKVTQQTNPQKCDNMTFQMAFLTYIKSREEKKRKRFWVIFIIYRTVQRIWWGYDVSEILTCTAHMSNTAQYVSACALTARPQLWFYELMIMSWVDLTQSKDGINILCFSSYFLFTEVIVLGILWKECLNEHDSFLLISCFRLLQQIALV